ncbi:MAG TPA: diguanylate cyclase [Chloroflexaceae bacterium]|nr:diguanylate cyclase [Chloroflexaceae bacterium]
MAGPVSLAAATLTQHWAPLLAGLSDPVLLLDADERLLGCTRAARALLGAAVDVPGAPARAVLGLEAGAPLAGEASLRPPASGVAARASLTLSPLADGDVAPAGSLLLIAVRSVEEPDARADSLEGRLREVALTISSSLDIDLVLGRVVRLSIELIGAAAGSLPLYDAHFDWLLPSFVVGIKTPVLEVPLRRGTGAIWRLVDTGEPFLHNDYAADPRALRELVDCGVVAAIAAPVRSGGQLLGVISLYHTEPGRRFSRRDLELLEMLGRYAGVALQNARRYQEALRESERRQLLYQASLTFGAALAPEELYQAIHRTLARMMPCDTVAIARLDAAAGEIEYVYLADGRGRWPAHRAPVSRGLLGWVTRTRASLRLTGCDPALEALFGAEPFGEGEDPTGSLVAVALQVGELVIGAITVQAVDPDAYTPDDLDALETLAATAAIALQNAHLFARVRELATTDALTGVANRRHFFELARLEVERAARYARPLSLLMLDADHFKQVNDRYGHVAGDEVLRAIAARCRASLREVDLIGRYGGEEFLALLPETAGTQALQVAERLREVVADEPVLTSAGPVQVRISLGVASLPGGAAATVEELLDQADRALYAAKAAGRNMVTG